jgi:hypothetical protein
VHKDSTVLVKSALAKSGSIMIGTIVALVLTPEAANIVRALITLDPVPPIPNKYNFIC